MTIAAAAAALFLGAALQSATGFGFALVSAPILFALLGPQEAVTTGVLVALVLNGLTVAGERRRPRVRVRDALSLLAWSLPGLALGAIALRELPDRLLSALVALAVLAGVGLRALSRRAAAAPAPRAWHRPAAGVTAGALSTSTSLSGPPLVFYLLERRAAPAQMRDTLAAIFFAQAALGVPALLATGTFVVPGGLAALVLATLVGQLVGRRAFGWLQGERYELAVYVVLVATALVAFVASAL